MPQDPKTTEISQYMDKLYDHIYVSEPPTYIILLEDVEVDGLILKAGHYRDGEWLHD